VIDVDYEFGTLRILHLQVLGVGGNVVTQPMIVPERVWVKWTTASDMKRHEVDFSLRAALAGRPVAGRTVSLEIDGSRFEALLLDEVLGGDRSRTLLYARDA
jgi:hypothetical protein